MLDVTGPASYDLALQVLADYKARIGRGHRGRFVQIFLALKFFQNELPSMFSGRFVSTGLLQTLLDDLYAKASRPATECVAMVFEKNHLARTGLIAPGHKSPQNTWRNNLNLQKGIGCYAPPQDLASATFLNQSRQDCRHLLPATQGTLEYARCQLCPNGQYRNEDHRKWLRIDAGGGGYAVVDLLNISNFTPYVAPGGDRIPLVPLIVAIYHDALPELVTGSRPAVSVSQFASDFGFDAGEMAAYFETSAANPLNQAVLSKLPGAALGVMPVLPAPVPAATPRRKLRSLAGPPAPMLTGTNTPPPMANSGWEAEAYVRSALETAGWTAYDVSRQKIGYDILAQRGRDTRYIDVKSSLGYCTPSLTAREWSQARAHGPSYVLAVIENFDDARPNTIYWVPDPTTCVSTQATTVSFSLMRSSWVGRIVSLASI
jgi:hypothetical protein